MSSDNCILLNIKTFEISYYQGDRECQSIQCKNLEEAVLKAKEIDEEYQVEYGIKFI